MGAQKRSSDSMVDINALFLGPQSENRDVFQDLIEFLVDEHIHWRRNFHPEDEPIITLQEQGTLEYGQTIERTRQMLLTLSAELRSGSMPWFSPRYLGHMTYDPMMAGSLAYFAALLYNPNNVAREGSPATTTMEVEVGQQLAELFGFLNMNGGPQPWGHITSGGTVANLEALWIAKTMKSVPIAIRMIEQEDVTQEELRGSSVSEGHTHWELLTLSPKATLDMLDGFLDRAAEVDHRGKLLHQVLDYSVRGLGIHQFTTAWTNGTDETGVTPPEQNGANGQSPSGVVLVPQSRHYCWDKAVDILGIGEQNLRKIEVDESTYRMDIENLKQQVLELADNEIPIIAIVAVVGSTEHGAVDSVDEIVAFRQECEKKHGISFYLHIDAAFGGYARTIFLDEDSHFIGPGQHPSLDEHFPEEMLQGQDLTYIGSRWPSDEVHKAFAAMNEADSITVDPHKWGYTPYSAGGFVVRDRRALQLISHSASYVTGIKTEDELMNPGHLGSFILEGSKSGASVASVWGTHKVTPLNVTGYGRLVGAGIEGAYHFYESLQSENLVVDNKTYVVKPLCEPDLNVVNFAFNREDNTSLKEMNKLNNQLYKQCTYNPDTLIPTQEFITSKTELTDINYGNAPEQFVTSMGIPKSEWRSNPTVLVLRSCVLTPFLAYGTLNTESAREELHDESGPYEYFFALFKKSMERYLSQID